MTITTPEFKRKENFAAVYKITFDDKWIYIGGSVSIRPRIRRWHFCFSTGKNIKSINIKKVLPNVSLIDIEVVQICTKQNVRKAENNWIKKLWEDPLLLNRCPNSYDNKGIRRPIGWKPTPKQQGSPEPPKPIAQFNKEGVVLNTFCSIGEASRKLCCNRSLIQRILSGRAGGYKRTDFKEINKDGSYKEHPKFIRKTQFYSQDIRAIKRQQMILINIAKANRK